MRIAGRPTGTLADSEATTGVGTRTGSTLDPKRMTDKERKAMRTQLTAQRKTAAAGIKAAASAADKLFEEIKLDAGSGEEFDESVIKSAEQAAADAKLGEIAANQARILLGEDITDEGDGDGTTLTAEDIKQMMADFYAKIQGDAMAQKREAAESAYNLLFDEFSRYGLGALVTPLRKYIEDGISAAEFTIRLLNEPAYKKRFAANEGRIQKGLRALSEAEYIGLEDQYQDIMRRYGMPETYYRQEKDPITGITLQPGFEKLIAGDVSAVELEDRVQTAYDRVINANPQISQTLREFYPEITNGDILAYALDPENAINNIKRKVTATEIGAAAAGEGLTVGGVSAKDVLGQRTRAQDLAASGVTGQQYRQAAPTIKEAATVGTRLANIYGDEKYGQLEAEAELLDLAGAGEAATRRKKLTGLETAQFSKSSGLARGALGRRTGGAI